MQLQVANVQSLRGDYGVQVKSGQIAIVRVIGGQLHSELGKVLSGRTCQTTIEPMVSFDKGVSICRVEVRGYKLSEFLEIVKLLLDDNLDEFKSRADELNHDDFSF